MKIRNPIFLVTLVLSIFFLWKDAKAVKPSGTPIKVVLKYCDDPVVKVGDYCIERTNGKPAKLISIDESVPGKRTVKSQTLTQEEVIAFAKSQIPSSSPAPSPAASVAASPASSPDASPAASVAVVTNDEFKGCTRTPNTIVCGDGTYIKTTSIADELMKGLNQVVGNPGTVPASNGETQKGQ